MLRYRKIVVVGRNRVLRPMRQEGLLAPTRRTHPHGDKALEGRIVTQQSNEIGGADTTRFGTEDKGGCWFFWAIDHPSDDAVGWRVAKVGNRFQTLEPIHQGPHREYGAAYKEVARDLVVRYDHGSQCVSDDSRGELACFGISISYAYVEEPEGNGSAERFRRTLKEHVLCCYRFKYLYEARRIIGEFIERYNRQRLIERLGYLMHSRARWRFAESEVHAA